MSSSASSSDQGRNAESSSDEDEQVVQQPGQQEVQAAGSPSGSSSGVTASSSGDSSGSDNEGETEIKSQQQTVAELGNQDSDSSDESDPVPNQNISNDNVITVPANENAPDPHESEASNDSVSGDSSANDNAPHEVEAAVDSEGGESSANENAPHEMEAAVDSEGGESSANENAPHEMEAAVDSEGGESSANENAPQKIETGVDSAAEESSANENAPDPGVAETSNLPGGDGNKVTDKMASLSGGSTPTPQTEIPVTQGDNLTQKDVFGSDSDSGDEISQPVTSQITGSQPTARDLLGDSSSDSDDEAAKMKSGISRKRMGIISDDESDSAVDKPKKSPLSDAKKRKMTTHEEGEAGSNDDEARRSDDDENSHDGGRRSSHDGDEASPEPEPAVPEEPEETQIEVDFPVIRGDLGEQMHLVKMPNFLSVETRPFDPLTYEDELDQDETMDEEGRTRLKLKVENTIRWRTSKTPDGKEQLDPLTGQLVRESNARIVRWSDDSLSLHLGSEIFDVHPMDIRSDFNHLFIRQGSGLQGQSAFKTRLTFRPHSTDSFTHRKITMSLANKSNKTQKVKILPIAGKDPESNRLELVKKEEVRLRASIKRENHQRRMRERAAHKELSSAMLEEDDGGDNENTISISKIKKSSTAPAKRNISALYSSASDSDDSLSSGSPGPVVKKVKAKVISDDEEDESDVSD